MSSRADGPSSKVSSSKRPTTASAAAAAAAAKSEKQPPSKTCGQKVKEACVEKLKGFLKKLPWIIFVAKICYLFSVVYEVCLYHAGIGPVYQLGTRPHDLRVLFIIFIVLGIFVLLLDSTILVLQFGNALCKKSLLVAVVGLHICLVVPWASAGLYISHVAHPAYMYNPSMVRYDDWVAAKLKLANRTTAAGKAKGCTSYNMAAMDDCAVRKIQEYGNCCGVHDAQTTLHNVSRLLLKSIKACPFKEKRSGDANTTTITFPSGSCNAVLKERYKMMLWLSFGGLLLYSVTWLLLAPFIYVLFELDRRASRAKFVHQWQKTQRIALEKQRSDARVLLGDEPDIEATQRTQDNTQGDSSKSGSRKVAKPEPARKKNTETLKENKTQTEKERTKASNTTKTGAAAADADKSRSSGGSESQETYTPSPWRRRPRYPTFLPMV